MAIARLLANKNNQVFTSPMGTWQRDPSTGERTRWQPVDPTELVWADAAGRYGIYQWVEGELSEAQEKQLLSGPGSVANQFIAKLTQGEMETIDSERWEQLRILPPSATPAPATAPLAFVADPNAMTYERALAIEMDRRMAVAASFVVEPQVDFTERNWLDMDSMDLLEWCAANGKPVLIEGDTGMGKSTVVRQFAATTGRPCCIIEANGTDTTTAVLGRKTVYGGHVVTELGNLPLAAQIKDCVILLDEVNAWPGKFTTALHGLLRDRRMVGLDGTTIEMAEGVLIVGTMNSGIQYTGTQRMNAAFKNRFPIVVSLDYERAVEARLVRSKELLDLAAEIRKTESVRTPLGTNRLMEFEEIALALGVSTAIRNFSNSFELSERVAITTQLSLRGETIADELGVSRPSSADEISTEFDVEVV